MVLARVTHKRRRTGTPLTGRVPPTPWDPTLAEAISAAGVIAYEEDVRAGLLDAIGYQVARPSLTSFLGSRTRPPG
jgi:hypothetical protein